MALKKNWARKPTGPDGISSRLLKASFLQCPFPNPQVWNCWKKMDILQEEIDLLVKRKEDYEAELAHNNDKREMLTLYKELTAKWETAGSYIRKCCIDSETANKLKKMMTLVVNNSTKAIQSESSARRLASEIELLRQDLKRVHTWNAKISCDLSSLKEQTSNVESELGTHRTQRHTADKREKKLQEESELLTKRQRYFRQVLEDHYHEYNNLRQELMKSE
ncbi:hypothetical protein D4764_19G0001870 [Takifugu flavidus]|uniref:Uncharacterized protein n=1 Tax=Takifugu flavidus TaxID=433684 RepID=A0A5C6NNX5_9TELE|nr:hypothetical protein D4764_19G0001870 [Takifugu flavidus]